MGIFNFKKKAVIPAKTSGNRIEIFKAINKQFYFRVVAENGETIAVSEAYKQKKMCKNGIESLRKNVNSEIVDLTL
jgi:hypothetical protein